MIKRLGIITLIFCLSGCTGMQLHTSQLEKQSIPPSPTVTPKLIPITPATVNELQRQTPSINYAYLIEPQDVLGIAVWGHPEFNLIPTQASAPTISLPGDVWAAGSGDGDMNSFQQGLSTATAVAPAVTPYLVNASGQIYFPLIGNVPVAGKSVEQIRGLLTERLSKYVRNPQVSVSVLNFRSQRVYVVGEVPKPGIQAISDRPLTLADSLNIAGGMDPQNADPKHIFVIRGNPTQQTVYWLDARSPTALLLAESFQLQPRDVVFVSPDAGANWNRVINQILPSVQTVWYTWSVTH